MGIAQESLGISLRCVGAQGSGLGEQCHRRFVEDTEFEGPSRSAGPARDPQRRRTGARRWHTAFVRPEPRVLSSEGTSSAPGRGGGVAGRPPPIDLHAPMRVDTQTLCQSGERPESTVPAISTPGCSPQPHQMGPVAPMFVHVRALQGQLLGRPANRTSGPFSPLLCRHPHAFPQSWRGPPVRLGSRTTPALPPQMYPWGRSQALEVAMSGQAP